MAGLPSFLSAPLHFTTSILKFASALPVIGQLKSYLPASFTYTDKELKNFAAAREWYEGSGRGYFAMLSTKPQTMAYSLNDSPSGLLGFLFEKLVAWTDNYPWTDDEVLTWASIYWFSEAGPGASGFIYKEANEQLKPSGTMPFTKIQGWVTMPIGLTYFPGEISNMPRSWATRLGKIVFLGEHDKGG